MVILMDRVKQTYKEYGGGKVNIYLDQASRLGYSIWEDGYLIESGKIDRKGKSIQEYGLMLIQFLDDICKEMDLNSIFYEEVFVSRTDNPGNVHGTEQLYYIKHKVKDYGFLNRIKTYGLDNASWKKYLSDKKTFNKGKKKTDKLEVERLVKKYLPDYTSLSEDETDAIGMGIAVEVNKAGNLYEVARYNKKLPTHWGYSPLDWEGFKEDGKLYKRFRDAIDAGGIKELELKRNSQIEDIFFRHLTHEDKLMFMIIPKDYMYYYFYMLTFGIKKAELKGSEEKLYLTNEGKYINELDEDSYIIYAARKKRLGGG